MLYIAKCWRGHEEKPVGIEYWSDISHEEVEDRVQDWQMNSPVSRIEVRDEEGELVAQYPTPAVPA